MSDIVQVKGSLAMDRWGPLLFRLQGVNRVARQKIADFIRPFYPIVPVDRTTDHPEYRGLADVDFNACLYLTHNQCVKELSVAIMRPHMLVGGLVPLPNGETEISIRGDFLCQYSGGPMSLKFRGSNPAEQKRLLDWIREYIPARKRGDPFDIEDINAGGSLKMWFSDDKQKEADIKIGVMPSLRFIGSALSQGRE